MEVTLAKAHMLYKSGDLAEAEYAFRELLSVSKNDENILRQLSQICYQRGNLGDSIDFLKKLCVICNSNFRYFYNTASVCKESNRLKEAIDYYQEAIRLKPDFVNAIVNLGAIYYEQCKYKKSLSCYRHALRLDPTDIKALYNTALSQVRVGLVKQATMNMKKVLSINPERHEVHSNYLFNLHYLTDMTAEKLYEEHVRWSEMHEKNIVPASQSVLSSESNALIRIGYVSPDLRQHSVAYFMLAILQYHDREAFETFCYSDTQTKDETTNKLESLSCHWRDSAKWSDDKLINKIRDDKIDVLVDLAGHSANNRLLVFARKPAPIQISYLGYPNITGLQNIDYRLTDKWADPEEDMHRKQCEKLVRLPHGFLCYTPASDTPEVNPLPALQSEKITFGCFNNLPKINSEVISTWSEILNAVPHSKLFLKTRGLDSEIGRERIYSEFNKYGVENNRIKCLGYIPGTRSHLELYNQIDIALDTFPYNGTTTTCEALWMGVPVITLVGNWHAARVGKSLLSAINLEEYITYSTNEYIQCSISASNQLEKLSILRKNLRHIFLTSSLMNKTQFIRDLEAAYRSIISTTRNPKPSNC